MSATKYLQTLTALDTLATDRHGLPLTLDAAMAEWIERLQHVAVVYLVGNGGSASVVAHAQNDLVKGGHVRALVFQDVPLLTAAANDCGYPLSQKVPLEVWIDHTDMLIAVSSSGQSENILEAVRLAQKQRATIVTCSGFDPGNPLRSMGHLNFYVPSWNYGHVELTHAALLHHITDEVARA